MYGTNSPIEIDLATQKAINTDSAEARFIESPFFGTRYIYQCTVKEDSAAKDLTGWQFRFCVNKPYELTTAGQDLVQAANALFNISGDWASLDLSTGLISWRADYYTAELKDAFAGDASELTTLTSELWGIPSGETDWILMAQWDTRLHNTTGTTVNDPPTDGTTWAALGDLDSRIESGVVLTIDVDGKMVVTVNGTERARI